MALVGYARISSVGQSLDVQLDKLSHCNKIFKEKKSGASDKRPRLNACLEYVKEGDTLVVTRLDRLARSTLHLCQIGKELQRKKVNLNVLDQNIDTGDATGRLLFNILGAISQFETELRAERQMDGILKAKEKGIKFGRKKSLTQAQIVDLQERRQAGELIKDLMNHYQLSKASVYRYLAATPIKPQVKAEAKEVFRRDIGIDTNDFFKKLEANVKEEYQHIDAETNEYFQRDFEAEDHIEREKSARRYIRLLLEEGHTFATVAKILNDKAYPTIGRKTQWTWQAVKSVSKK
jgi:DNA invertase Pin-like site-specific DNA recombinase